MSTENEPLPQYNSASNEDRKKIQILAASTGRAVEPIVRIQEKIQNGEPVGEEELADLRLVLEEFGKLCEKFWNLLVFPAALRFNVTLFGDAVRMFLGRLGNGGWRLVDPLTDGPDDDGTKEALPEVASIEIRPGPRRGIVVSLDGGKKIFLPRREAKTWIALIADTAPEDGQALSEPQDDFVSFKSRAALERQLKLLPGTNHLANRIAHTRARLERHGYSRRLIEDRDGQFFRLRLRQRPTLNPPTPCDTA